MKKLNAIFYCSKKAFVKVFKANLVVNVLICGIATFAYIIHRIDNGMNIRVLLVIFGLVALVNFIALVHEAINIGLLKYGHKV